MNSSIKEIQETTEKDIDNQIQAAEGGDEEAAYIVQLRLEYSLKKQIVLVLEFLGISEAVDCGVFGSPRNMEPLVYMLKLLFEDALVSLASGKSYFNPPYNEEELALQCLRDWLWITVVQRHHLDIVKAFGD